MRTLRATFAAAVLLSCAATSAAQQASQVELRLAADRTTFALGEPVVVTAALANTGAAEAAVYPLFEPTYGFVTYAITKPGGQREPFRPMWLDEGEARTVPLAPGAEVRGFVRLFHSATGAVFDVAGDYLVEAESAGLRSAPLMLRVDPAPTAAADAARTMLRRDVTEFMYLEGGAHLKDARAALGRIQPAASPALAGYARYFEGAAMAAGGRDFATGKSIPPRPREAIGLLEQALSAPLTSCYAARCEVLLVRSLVQTGELGRAREQMQRLEERFGKDDRTTYQRQLLRELVEKSGR